MLVFGLGQLARPGFKARGLKRKKMFSSDAASPVVHEQLLLVSDISSEDVVCLCLVALNVKLAKN